MSMNAQVAVLNLSQELSSDEFRLLITISLTAASQKDLLQPTWKTIFRVTGFTENQCRRILKGLHSDGIVKFATSDPRDWFIMNDFRLPLPINDNLSIWIKGMELTGDRHGQAKES